MELVEKNYKKGDAFPVRTNTDVLRIYSNQFCPFAERTLLVLAAKDIKHEVINVNLRDQLPEWVRERNPKGQVPFIEFGPDNKVLNESLITSDFLDEAYPGRQLTAADTYQKYKERLFVETIVPNLMVFAKILFSKDDKETIRKQGLESFKKADQLLAQTRKGKFISGKDLPGITDYMIWPFIERTSVSLELIGEENPEQYLNNELPTIADYTKQLRTDPTIQKVSLDAEVLRNFNKAYISKRKTED